MIQKPKQIHEKVWIPKSLMSQPPAGFEETWMGELDGARRQYRGPDNLHLHEYEHGWKLHYDYGDPRTLAGFVIHVFLDAPEVGISLLLAIDKAKKKYDETKSVIGSVLTFVGTGIVYYLGFRLLKEAIVWIVSWLSK